MKPISGRFECSASSAVSMTGTVTIDAPAMAPAISGLTLARIRASRARAGEPVPEHKSGQHIDREQRHLIAPEHDQRRRTRRERAPAPGRAIERARQQPQRQRQEREAIDLADVLEPRAAEPPNANASAATSAPPHASRGRGKTG